MRCIMRYKQLLAAASAAIFLLACASCGNDTTLTVDESSSVSSSGVSSGDTEPTVGEVIQPKEDSAEYDLGTYRLSSTGVKLYYDEDIPVEETEDADDTPEQGGDLDFGEDFW